MRFTKHDYSILIANIIDHFDTAIYTFLVPVLAPLFFPKQDPVVQLIALYSLCATSLITRPLGVVIFRNIVNKHGPIQTLLFSLYGLTSTTIAFSMLPTYKTIGWWSTLLLILVRMLRGIFATGESTVAKMYLLENKKFNIAFHASYGYQSSSMIGIIIASFLSTLVIFYSNNYIFLWRLAFFFGGLLGSYAFILRRIAQETHTVTLVMHNKKNTCQLLWYNKYKLYIIAITTALGHITYNIPFVCINTLVPLITNIPLNTMMQINTILLVFDLICIELLGRYLQKFCLAHTMLMATCMLAISMPVLFYFLPNASLYYVIFLRIWIIFWGVFFSCPLNLFYQQLLLTNQEKYLVVGIGSTLGASTIGRLTPALCLWLWHASHETVLIGLYVAVIAILTIFAIGKVTIHKTSYNFHKVKLNNL